jgi:uncharacterized membrane protein YhfC
MISFTLFFSLLTAGLLEIFIPIILGLWVRSKLGAKWSVYLIGAALWFIAYLIRTPINSAVLEWVYISFTGSAFIYLSIAFPSLTAGLFEEGARWLAFRFAIKDHRLENGIMYGAGHGGIESILLVGFSVLTTAVAAYFYPQTLPSTQLNAIAATPEWVAFVGLWERLAALSFHVGMSVLVLQSFRQKQLYYLGVAIAAHFFLNFTAIYAGQWGIIASEAVTTAWGLAALFYIWTSWRSYKSELAAAPAAQAPETPAAPNPV